MRVSFIIPVYNEEVAIEGVIERVLALKLDKEVIIVDDGSTDSTLERVRRFADVPSVQIHSSLLNLGKGAAVRIGIHHARGEVIAIQDGDTEYDAEDYYEVLRPILEGRAEVVYGSRFANGFRIEGMRPRYKLANLVLRWVANFLYDAGITDEATAYKAFRSDVLKGIRLECMRFEFCPEVTAKLRKRGYTIHEVPISYRPRGVEVGKKIRWKDGFVAIWTLLKYRVTD